MDRDIMLPDGMLNADDGGREYMIPSGYFNEEESAPPGGDGPVSPIIGTSSSIIGMHGPVIQPAA